MNDKSHKTLKNLEEESVDNDEKLKMFNEIEEEDRTINELWKDYSEKFIYWKLYLIIWLKTILKF